jgi:FtsP/CotA-like multicopper oxidase with cupredoxin domain
MYLSTSKTTADFEPKNFAYQDQLLVLSRYYLHNNDNITVKALECSERLHAKLPETTLWRYNNTIPVFEIESGSTIHVNWLNKIHNLKLPFVHGITETDSEMNIAGRGPAFHDAENAANEKYANPYGIPRTVTHLHGAIVQSDSDGWTDNVCYKNQFQHYIYHNNQRATMLWFHDHAMAVTRLNVYAGLLGLWIIRDQREKALNLPSGDKELLLVLQDRNLDKTDDGIFTGNILHKVTDDTMEFFGPYNIVNGKIWPHYTVKPNRYRLRILNAANARTYKLAWVDKNNQPVKNIDILKIGTDQGFLDTPIKIDNNQFLNGLVLAPGERIDIIIDFKNCKNREVYLKNIAAAPWNGTNLIDLNAAPINENHNPFPEIMKFTVSDIYTTEQSRSITVNTKLSNFHQFTGAELHRLGTHHNHKHRYIYLEEENDMVLLKELLPFENFPLPAQKNGESDVDYTIRKGLLKQHYKDDVGTIVIKDLFDGAAAVKEFYVAAKNFNDAVTINDIMLSDDGVPTEIWKIINATPDAHPFHIHLAQSQVLERFSINTKQPDGTIIYDLTTTGKIPIAGMPAGQIIWPNDRGWKDVMVINNSVGYDSETGNDEKLEVMIIAPNFEQYEGRYMYHCHILEHEDHEMMRPIIVGGMHMEHM